MKVVIIVIAPTIGNIK